MKSITTFALLLTFVLGGTGLSAFAEITGETGKPTPSILAVDQTDSEQNFHIDKDGNVNIRQVKIYQIAGTTFYARYYIGLAFIRMIIKTSVNTKVRRRFGDEISLKEIMAGDTVNVLGKIETGSDSLSVVASDITNFSNQKKITGFTGTVATLNNNASTFVLTNRDQNMITVNVGTTTQIKKGNRIIPLTLVRVGDTIIDASGTYDQATKNLDARVVAVYADMKIFEEKNFQGTLKAVSENNPANLIVVIDGKDYSIVLSDNAQILNKKRQKISFKRFLPGDILRLYGAIQEAEEPIIDAQIVRDMDL